MVTTIDGSAKRVTSTPFRKPHTVPVARATSGSVSAGKPAPFARPIATDASASVPATEMSISRQMINRAIGSAISAFSLKFCVPSSRLTRSRKCGSAMLLATKTTMNSMASKLSQRPRMVFRRGVSRSRIV